MKLVRYGKPGKEKPGLIDSDGRLRDLSAVVADIGPDQLSDPALARLRKLKTDTLPLVKGSPRTSCIQGPDDPVMLPKGSKKSDWEVELGVVIGRQARHVSQKDALSHVAGYCVVNDVSERAFQIERGGTWDKGKGCDTFGPIGPWLVTRDEIANPQRLDLWLDLNGHRMQNGNTRTMIFSVAKVVSYVSQFMTLMPGDVITTGTPPGVGMGMKPPVFLKKGDVLTLGVQGLGTQRQVVVPFML